MKKRAIIYLIRLGIQKIIGIALYFIGAGYVLNLGAKIYFALYIVMTMICGMILFRTNVETLAERNKTNTNSPARADHML